MSDYNNYSSFILFNYGESDETYYEELLHDSPFSQGIDNSSQVDNIATNVKNLHIQTPPQQRIPTSCPSSIQAMPANFLIANNHLDNDFTNSRQSLAEPNLDETI